MFFARKGSSSSASASKAAAAAASKAATAAKAAAAKATPAKSVAKSAAAKAAAAVKAAAAKVGAAAKGITSAAATAAASAGKPLTPAQEKKAEHATKRADAQGQAAAQEEAGNSPDGKIPYEGHLKLSNSAAWSRIEGAGLVYLDRVAPGEPAEDPAQKSWESGEAWPVDLIAALDVGPDGTDTDPALGPNLRKDTLPKGARVRFLAGGAELALPRDAREEFRVSWNGELDTLTVQVESPDGRKWFSNVSTADPRPERGRVLLVRKGTGPATGVPYEPHLKKTDEKAWKRLDKGVRLYLGRVPDAKKAPAPEALSWVNDVPWVVDVMAVVKQESDGKVAKNELEDGLRIVDPPKKSKVKVTDATSGDVLSEGRGFDEALEVFWMEGISKVKYEVVAPGGKQRWTGELTIPTEHADWSTPSFLIVREPS